MWIENFKDIWQFRTFFPIYYILPTFKTEMIQQRNIYRRYVSEMVRTRIWSRPILKIPSMQACACTLATTSSEKDESFHSSRDPANQPTRPARYVYSMVYEYPV